jgi:hypothetical protein
MLRKDKVKFIFELFFSCQKIFKRQLNAYKYTHQRSFRSTNCLEALFTYFMDFHPHKIGKQDVVIHVMKLRSTIDMEISGLTHHQILFGLLGASTFIQNR